MELKFINSKQSPFLKSTFNRTAYGIEMNHVDDKNATTRPFNRTAYGIEITIPPPLHVLHVARLLIAPLMELK